MIKQISLSGKLVDTLYKAKETPDNDYQKVDNDYQEVLEWTMDIIENENRPKLNYCEICHSSEKLERHHIRGRKHGNECITVCQECHKTLTDKQRLWDRSWLSVDAKNKDAFLIRGLIDVSELIYKKTNKEIFKTYSEILTEGFSYE